MHKKCLGRGCVNTCRQTKSAASSSVRGQGVGDDNCCSDGEISADMLTADLVFGCLTAATKKRRNPFGAFGKLHRWRLLSHVDNSLSGFPILFLII